MSMLQNHNTVDIPVKMTVNFTGMFPRILSVPQRSFFLFGPRSTGKSTWLRHTFPHALSYDFLRNDVLHRFLRRPGELHDEVITLPQGSWVVLDEIQRVPALLNEVQSLIESFGYKFALSGSSARKLKQKGANLLAGRVMLSTFRP